MITVNYLDGVDNIRCDEHLFQWDNGQKLCLLGLNTYVSNLETVDVHFCNKISKFAITVKPTVVSNNIVAPIPNSLLQDPYPIIAYFYVPSDNGSRTIVMVTIPIEPKKRPSDFILNEDEAIASLDAINNKVNATLNNITVDYNNFKVRIEKELQDTVENLKLDDAKTLQSHPASDFALKTEIPTSLPANGGNADTVDGKHASQFVNYSGRITDVDNILNNAKYDGAYECIINGDEAVQIGLAKHWWHLKYFKNSGTTGYGSQLAFPFGHSTVTSFPKYRNSDGETWNSWNNLAEKVEIPTSLPANGGNADTVDGKHASKFVNHLEHVSDVTNILNNSKYNECPYECVINADEAEQLGLPKHWWHLKYFKNSGAGFACQLVLPFGNNTLNSIPMYRISNGATWKSWTNLADGGNASTVNGVKLMVGTREPQCEEPQALAYVPEGAWYGQY